MNDSYSLFFIFLISNQIKSNINTFFYNNYLINNKYVI